MHQSRRFGAALLLGVLTVMLGSLPGAAYASNQVPFKLTISGQDTLVTQNCPTICFANSGAGTAAHLGAFTSRGLIVLTSLSFPSATQLEVTTYETYVFRAANGDVVDLTNYATGVEDLATGLTSITGHWVITGGTGRFSGATGSGTTSGTLQASIGGASATATLVGTILIRPVTH